MRVCMFLMFAAVALILAACSPSPDDDREAIESIVADLEEGSQNGDLMLVDRHLSPQAKAEGFEANRFLMECSYGEVAKPEFTARTIQVMGDSAHVSFAVIREGAQFLEGMRKSDVRLSRSGHWKILSYQLQLNP